MTNKNDNRERKTNILKTKNRIRNSQERQISEAK